MATAILRKAALRMARLPMERDRRTGRRSGKRKKNRRLNESQKDSKRRACFKKRAFRCRRVFAGTRTAEKTAYVSPLLEKTKKNGRYGPSLCRARRVSWRTRRL
jgi:hypothetical protein